jgi:CRISPR-associated endonuclease/helicase Cas3
MSRSTNGPAFARFFEALHGKSPFPWQRRLAAEVLEKGWPDLLDLPTGVGKTSTLEISLYCLARAPERMPRRTLLVVDRRIVVDQGALRARAILAALQGAKDGPLREIADALRKIGGAGAGDAPFAIAVMRGGMPRDNDWASRHDQPVLGVSTVDQVGSRLLFRGYGVSPRSASIHAGLLGNDTLILLDEVHLAVPFAQTLATIRRRYRAAAPGLPGRFEIVRMSATPGATPPEHRVFRLDDDDRTNPVLRLRLSASKRAALAQVKVSGQDERVKQEAIARRVIEDALALQAKGARIVGAIVNRVDTARIARRLLRAHERTTEAMLVTGRMRPLDRDRVAGVRLLQRAGASRTRAPEDRPLVVVATQCVEAGADLDFDGMVTECASLDALRQRFGRVDRCGELKETRSVILGRSDQVVPGGHDPVYGDRLAATWQWLGENASGGAIDFGLGALPAPVDPDGELREELLAPVLEAPVLLPTHLDGWSQTSQRPAPDQDVALWLHGPKENPADVQVVWRAGVDLEEERVPEVVERLAACRPSSLEAATVPLAAVRRWLTDEPAAEIADVVGGIPEEDEERRERRERTWAQVALRWCGDNPDSRAVTADEIRPGDVLVVDVTRGGLDDYSFDPESKAPVVDLGDLAQLRGRGIASLRLDPRALAAWDLPEDVLVSMPRAAPDEPVRELQARVVEWLGRIPRAVRPGFLGTEHEWGAALGAWSKQPRVAVVGGTIIVTARVPKGQLLGELEASEALTEDEDSAFRQAEVSLRDHSKDVRTFAERFGRAIGFGEQVVEDLALAGWLHDVGKADPRFQRWLVGGGEVRASLLPEPLAKSALPAGNAQQRRQARERAGYPDGYRHELLSLEMIRSCEEVLQRAHDRELVMHLVASHHGWCRPFAPPLDDPEELDVRLDHGGDALAGTTRHRLARLDSGISDRFWALTEKYGWWGLAWLEAVLRLADHRASEEETEARS